MCAKELYIIVVSSGLAASGVSQVGGMRVYTSGEVEAVNGTDLRLKCTFDSSAEINPNLVTISWNFKPSTGKPTLRIFFYHIKPYPPNEGIFKKRISWAGDIMGSDASIIIREVEFKYNGTYTCQVTNPPDVHGQVGEIRLRVVKTGLSRVSSISVKTPAEIHASKGDTVTLSCTFTTSSSPTSKMSVHWSYRPQTGGPPSLFFHFSSRAYPPDKGQFAGRIRWSGRPARGDASIALINATSNDNGTYTCDVTNPPDVYGSPNSHTVLTVSPKASTIRFSDVAVLLAFVLIPSGLITFFSIGRMFCPKKQHNQSKAYRSPIEVTEGEEYVSYPQAANTRSATCCDLYLMDSEDETEYYMLKKRQPREMEYDESQC